MASNTNEDERSNLSNVNQDKNDANELKTEEGRTTKTHKKIDEPYEENNANNKVGIVSDKVNDNTKKLLAKKASSDEATEANLSRK